MGSVYVAGHRGLVGSAICRRLQKEGTTVITASRDQVDLKSRSEVDAFFAEFEIEQVYLAAAKVGGIYANDAYPAEFIYDNLTIQTNVIDAAWRAGVKKLLFLGSSCIYPKHSPQPMTQDCLPGVRALRASYSIRPACRHLAGSHLSVSRRVFAVPTTGTRRTCINNRLRDEINGRD